MKRCLLICFVVAFVSLPALPLFAQSVPEIAYDSAPNLLKLPADIYLGEAGGGAEFQGTYFCVHAQRRNAAV